MTDRIGKSPVHGTAVAVNGQGFLILGPSGSGKSGLALQMIALGASLVADDQVILESRDAQIWMSSPAPLHGLIEARGFGLLKQPALSQARLSRVVDLSAEPETRMPHPSSVHVMGSRIDLIKGRNLPNLASILLLLGRDGPTGTP
ncbi:HPr kinase/phosphorylase [Neptunicoccus cionae]|uniref:HPr kinase/phosphorylase n=1 Tax=Neptunicoccus cionae TaxID=2035344 RepID=UPI000C765BDB|nr:HPr kinase/phosphatase C-terminal domain-containing protein [Amylibacter cionae]PLS21790.1 serine kinase [Amylibacter cionae]